MITENDISVELKALNDVAAEYGRNYEYRKGDNDGQSVWGLFDVHDEVYKPIYCAGTASGFFAYVSLLKNIYKKGMIPGEKSEE